MGVAVGVKVGVIVGVRVAVFVGLSVGVADGMAVGVTVGGTVGVGLSVPLWPALFLGAGGAKTKSVTAPPLLKSRCIAMSRSRPIGALNGDPGGVGKLPDAEKLPHATQLTTSQHTAPPPSGMTGVMVKSVVTPKRVAASGVAISMVASVLPLDRLCEKVKVPSFVPVASNTVIEWPVTRVCPGEYICSMTYCAVGSAVVPAKTSTTFTR